MNGKSKLWALALLIGVLVLGGVGGAAVDRSLADSACPAANRDRRSREDRDRGYLDWLSSELALTPEQRAEVEKRVERHRAAVRELWGEMRPRFEAMKSELRNDIREVLNEDQIAAYDSLLERADRHRRGHDEGDKQGNR
jgi:hypothetical protein